MFVDLGGNGPWRAEAPKPRLSPRGQKALLWVLGVNALLLLLAPIGGSTVIAALLALLG